MRYIPMRYIIIYVINFVNRELKIFPRLVFLGEIRVNRLIAAFLMIDVGKK